ncbi:hypothetical protein [Desulfosporosinus sp. FKB]|uniref:hypothetical protein n=1 Tax=Desulfosporosinus sp. FKB TaxID=1969835 RepID=UPI000B4A10AF|nr:hypothetical protein [Desulfosporosinus sp. FKB]
MLTGLTLHLYPTKQEMDNAKNGVSTIVAWSKGKQSKEATYHISASADICDILDGEVRINIIKTDGELEKMSAKWGLLLGAELEKVFSKFS